MHISSERILREPNVKVSHGKLKIHMSHTYITSSVVGSAIHLLIAGSLVHARQHDMRYKFKDVIGFGSR